MTVIICLGKKYERRSLPIRDVSQGIVNANGNLEWPDP